MPGGSLRCNAEDCGTVEEEDCRFCNLPNRELGGGTVDEVRIEFNVACNNGVSCCREGCCGDIKQPQHEDGREADAAEAETDDATANRIASDVTRVHAS